MSDGRVEDAYIFAAGLADPARIQRDPANAPQLGKWKVIVPR